MKKFIKKVKGKALNSLSSFKSAAKIVGPGMVTGFSDDDPSGIGTYSIAGARYGLQMIWLNAFQLPFMIAIQEMCARIGLVTGRGLSGNIKKLFSKKWLFILVLLLVFANIVNIGADISAMAFSLDMVFGGNVNIWAFAVVLIIMFLEIFISYRYYVKILKWLMIPVLCYIVVAFMVVQDWGEVFKFLFIPSIEFKGEFIMMMVGFIGTTISPYLFFWQASEEIEEEIMEGKIQEMGDKAKKVSPEKIKKMRWDTIVGMTFSQVIAFFIVLTCASTLFKAGIFEINTAADTAKALRPLAGDGAYLLFATGIVGAGFLGIPILAGSAAYALSETFSWREGLFHKFKEAINFYGVIILSTLLGLAIHLIGINPMKALLYAAVVNGVVAVPLVAFIVLIANNKKVMGKHKNAPWLNVLGWSTFVLMLLSTILMFVFWGK